MAPISILVEDKDQSREEILGVLEKEMSKVVVKEINSEKVGQSLSLLIGELHDIVNENDVKVGKLSLSEIQVNVEINAEGGVSLIGTAKAGIKGAISLKFTRQS